jgi:hypothetical protein
LLATQVFLGFERKPVERPARRWVIVADNRPDAAADAEQESSVPVESAGQNPAA